MMTCRRCLHFKYRTRNTGDCYAVPDNLKRVLEDSSCHKWEQKVDFHAAGDVGKKIFPLGVKKW
jgi:hypothetical protein